MKTSLKGIAVTAFLLFSHAAHADITIAPISNVTGGTTFPVIPCAQGGKPWATYSAQVGAINDTVIPPVEVLRYSVNQNGSSWVTLTQAIRPPSTTVTINNDLRVLGMVPVGIFSAGCSSPNSQENL